LNPQYLEQALDRIKNSNVLVNMVSRRVFQLFRGHRAMVRAEEGTLPVDVVLLEIAEGKLSYEPDPEGTGEQMEPVEEKTAEAEE